MITQKIFIKILAILLTLSITPLLGCEKESANPTGESTLPDLNSPTKTNPTQKLPVLLKAKLTITTSGLEQQHYSALYQKHNNGSYRPHQPITISEVPKDLQLSFRANDIGKSVKSLFVKINGQTYSSVQIEESENELTIQIENIDQEIISELNSIDIYLCTEMACLQLSQGTRTPPKVSVKLHNLDYKAPQLKLTRPILLDINTKDHLNLKLLQLISYKNSEKSEIIIWPGQTQQLNLIKETYERNAIPRRCTTKLNTQKQRHYFSDSKLFIIPGRTLNTDYSSELSEKSYKIPRNMTVFFGVYIESNPLIKDSLNGQNITPKIVNQYPAKCSVPVHCRQNGTKTEKVITKPITTGVIRQNLFLQATAYVVHARHQAEQNRKAISTSPVSINRAFKNYNNVKTVTGQYQHDKKMPIKCIPTKVPKFNLIKNY